MTPAKSLHHVVMYSGGIGSYMAAKRVVAAHGAENATLLFADTRIEDEDLYRFLDESAVKLGTRLVKIAEGSTVWELFRKHRFLGNSRIDLCSRILKRELMDRWVKERYEPVDVRCYVGIDWNEEHRFTRMAPRKLPYVYLAPLLEPPLLLKEDMLAELERDGITMPRLYRMGFSHNNCGGFCVKAGVGHFKLLLTSMRARYIEHEEQELAFQVFIGKPVTILRRQRNGVRENLSLRQLRLEIEAGATVDETDVGGCGCMIDINEALPKAEDEGSENASKKPSQPVDIPKRVGSPNLQP